MFALKVAKGPQGTKDREKYLCFVPFVAWKLPRDREGVLGELLVELYFLHAELREKGAHRHLELL